LEGNLSKFERKNFGAHMGATYIGKGSLGGKARGLCKILDLLQSKVELPALDLIEVELPRFTVIRTDVFKSFMKNNNLYEIALSGCSDDRIAYTFQKANLPFDILGDLRALISKVHHPLAVRSSSLLEDARYEPFAGIYATKMTPNNQPDTATRFQKLVESIKYVYASTFFKSARDYMEATNQCTEDEQMAVIIQDVVGKRHDIRFYPEISGVARSYNFYPLGRAEPGEGVVSLALGLGKTIVDGSNCWSYSPAHPRISSPYESIPEMLKQTQNQFWAINMGNPASYAPQKETEYMMQEDLTLAEKDHTLKYIASTLDRYTDHLSMGTGAEGARVLTFAPLLNFNDIPINLVVKSLLVLCEEIFNSPVEIEFAMTLSDNEIKTSKHQFGFLQVRPMVVSTDEVHLDKNDFDKQDVLVAS
jgi:phosphoenolpyruvate synthase/pyruvate phosphate dikinase